MSALAGDVQKASTGGADAGSEYGLELAFGAFVATTTKLPGAAEKPPGR
jgi:hypothetical protein